MASLGDLHRVAIVVVLASVSAGAANHPLTEAVKRGDAKAVQALLRDRGVAVNAPDPEGMTALHWAVLAGDALTTERLLKARANVNAGNRFGVTPLTLAAENGDAAMMKRLLDAGADAGARRNAGDTVLMIAARSGNTDGVRLLAGYGADVNDREATMGETALAWAAAENHADTVAMLIELGADVNRRSDALSFPEFQWQGFGMVSTRLPRGGWTPLMHAARQGALAGARALVDHDADLDLRDPDGTTALVIAIINAHYDLAALLLERGADPNVMDSNGMTALYALVDMRSLAPMQGRPAPTPVGETDTIALFRQLIAKRADPNARLLRPVFGRHHGSGDPALGEGSTPLLRAAKSLDVEMMRLLLDNGADPFATKADGTTALVLAAGGQAPRSLGLSPAATTERTIAAARLLLDRGVDVNAFNRAGQTALHVAAERGANAVVQLLADRGADLDIADRDGRTPLDLALRNNQRGPRNAGSNPTASLLQQLLAAPSPERSKLQSH